MRELALEHAAGTIGDEAYLARLKVLRQQRGAVTERTTAGLPTERALEWLYALAESPQAPEKSREKADVLHAIYERITVAGPEIVGVRLTQAAYAHGLALALPERLNWRARQDSNLRPSAPEADALSTELQARGPR
jgi:hypothetical protein